MTQYTANGNTYSDDGSTPKDMLAGKFRDNLLPMLSDTMVDAAAKVAAAAAQAAIATDQANIAIGAAMSTVTGPGSTGTSTNNLTVGLGSKSFTIQTGKTLYVGMPIVIAASASPDDAMYGPLMSYNPANGATVVKVTNISQSVPGVFLNASAWTVSLSGPAGVTGVLNEFKAAPIATAATMNLDAATGNLVHWTGSVTVNGITLAAGAERTCVLDAAPLLTNSANLICPGGANIQGAAGDSFVVRGEGSGVVKITSYERASGRALVAPYALGSPIVLTPSVAATLDALNFVTPNANGYLIQFEDIAPVSGGSLLTFKFANAGVVDAASNYRGGTGIPTPQLQTTLSSGSAAVSGQMQIHNCNSGAGVKAGLCYMSSDGGSQILNFTYSGSAISGIRFFWWGGQNFAAQGAVRIYPILNA